MKTHGFYPQKDNNSFYLKESFNMTQSLGGIHCVTATLTNALAREGVSNPTTGKPFSEAMILGIGGGLGAGYILWEFKGRDSANIVMGFRNRWNYAMQYITNACQRLNVSVDERETGSAKKAQSNLDEALEQGKPVLVWIDKASMSYHSLPEQHIGHLVHIIGVHSKDGDTYTVDDLADKTWAVSADDLAVARKPIPSNKQRTVTLNPSYEFDLKLAVSAGIQDHIEYLSSSSESFSLPTIKKWSKMMVHPKNKKSWQVVFKKRAGLYTTLRSVYEGITLDNTEGAGLRDMYADFLTEADAIIDADLSDAIQAYRICADVWRDFANTALSDEVPAFAQAKQLMQTRYKNFAQQNVEELAKNIQEMDALEPQYNLTNFPLDDEGVTALFEAMQNKLDVIYDVEQTALATLIEAVNS
jgi:hypothetical protein